MPHDRDRTMAPPLDQQTGNRALSEALGSRRRLRTEGVKKTAVIARARADTNAGLGTVDYVGLANCQARVASRHRPGAAAATQDRVALWQERGCDAAAGSEVANVLADRVTVAASKRPGALALIDRAGARSSPRISSQLDDKQQLRTGRWTPVPLPVPPS
jgi:hypothetical protein